MPSGSRGFALESGLLHKSARHNPLLGIKHLRFRAGHHRRRARQAASGCPPGSGGEGKEALGSCRLTHARPRTPIFAYLRHLSVSSFSVALPSWSERAALRSVNGLEAEREAFGRPFWRN